jgi:triacylglycerol lipase
LLDALSPARRRFTLATLAGLVIVVLVVVAVPVVRGLADGSQPVDQARPGPVVLVTGYGGSVGSLEPLRQSLRAAGREVVVVPPVAGGTGDLRAQAEALDTVARAARDRSRAASVDVVGYSAGGVVARLWVRDLGGDAVARRVVSIGSPHHGTEVAALASGSVGCPVACQQLAPGRRLLRTLNAGD